MSVYDTMTPEQRTARARLAAETRWANVEDRTEATRPGRTAFLAQFKSKRAKKAYFAELGRKSVIARRRKP